MTGKRAGKGRRTSARRPRLARKHVELLQAVEKLGRDAQDVELAAGLPQGWLSKARAGDREGPKADAGWDKLEHFLGGCFLHGFEVAAAGSAATTRASSAFAGSAATTSAGRAVLGLEVAAGPLPPAPSSPKPAGVISTTEISAEEIQKVEKEIAKAFEDVTTAEELLALDKRVAAETARGILDPRKSNALRMGAIEIRQVLEMSLAEKAQKTFANLIPMTREEAEAFYAAREKTGAAPLKPGESVAAPESPS